MGAARPEESQHRHSASAAERPLGPSGRSLWPRDGEVSTIISRRSGGEDSDGRARRAE